MKLIKNLYISKFLDPPLMRVVSNGAIALKDELTPLKG